jgi:penicillin-binding protein-related factor A (putative recombinase)
MARFNPEKDYDSYVCFRGCFTAMEYKLHKKKTAFPLNSVNIKQRAALTSVRDSGCNAYVVVCVRYDNVRNLYFIPIKAYLIYVHEHERKSMPLKDMEEYPRASWEGKGQWRLDERWFTY